MATRYYAVSKEMTLGSPCKMRLGGFHPRLQTSDKIVLFERNNTSIDFTGTCEVKSATLERKDTPKTGVASVNVVTFSTASPFKTARPLTALAGSLQKVSRFLEPESHFQRDTVALDQGDYDAIAEYKIAVARSIFR